MRKLALFSLWLALCLVIWAAYLWAPPIEGFIGLSDRIFYFHVPMAITAFVAFMTAGVWSVLFLLRGGRADHDRAAHAAVQLGLLFCILATVTGAMWAKTMWGAYWNWDPRQISIAFTMLFYFAYLALRGSILDLQARRVLAAAYATFGLILSPLLFFVAPRVVDSLHPQPLINREAKIDVDPPMLAVFLLSMSCFIALFYWMHDLNRRAMRLSEQQNLPASEVYYGTTSERRG
jgi:heme exporter protein C